MPLYSLRNVYILKGELRFRTEPTNKMSISMSTCVPSGLSEGADSIYGYIYHYLIERVKCHLGGRNEITRENITHCCWRLGRYSIQLPPHYKSTALPVHKIIQCLTC